MFAGEKKNEMSEGDDDRDAAIQQLTTERDELKKMFREEVARLEKERDEALVSAKAKANSEGTSSAKEDRAALKEKALILKKRQAELVAMQKKLKEASAKLKKQKEILGLKKNELMDEKRAFKETLASFESKKAEQEEHFRKRENNLDSREKQAGEELASEQSELQTQLEAVESALSSEKTERERLQGSVERLSSELDDARARAESEIAAKDAALKKATEEAERVAASRTNDELASAKRAAAQLEQDLKRSMEARELLETELVSAKTARKEAEESLKQNATQIAALNEKLSGADGDAEIFKTKFEQSEAARKALEEQLRNAKTEMEDIRACHKKDIAARDACADAATQHTADLKSELERTKSSRENLEKQLLEASEGRGAEMKNVIDELNQRHANELEAVKSSASNAEKVLRAEVDSAAAESARLTEALKAAKEMAKIQVENCAAANDREGALKTALEEAKSMCESFEKKMTDLSKERSGALAAIKQEHAKEVAMLQSEAEKNLTERARLSEELAAARQDGEKQADELRKTIASSERSYKDELALARGECDALQKKLKEMDESHGTSLRDALDSLKQDHAKDVDALKSEAHEATRALKEEHEKAVAENERLSGELETAAKRNRELEEITAAANERSDRLEEQLGQGAAESQDLHSQLKADFDAAAAENERLTKALEEAETVHAEQIGALQAKVVAIGLKSAEFEEELGRARPAAESAETSRAETARLQGELEALKAKGAAHKEKYVNVKKQYSESKKKLKQATQELAACKEAREDAEKRAEGLMQEGLALSKKQGKHEQAMRKLRQMKRDADAEVERLKQDMERAVSRKEQDVENANRARDEARAALEAAKAELDAQSKSIDRRKLDSSAAQRDVQAVKVQLEERIEAARVLQERVANLEGELEESRVASEEQQLRSDEDVRQLRKDLEAEKKRLRDAEARNEQLAASATTATAPLLRQIEALQNVGKARRDALDASQDALLVRAVTAEKGEHRANKLLRQAEEDRTQLSIRIAEFETTIMTLKSQQSRVKGDAAAAVERIKRQQKDSSRDLELAKAAVRELEEKVSEMTASSIKLRQSMVADHERAEAQREALQADINKQKREFEAELSSARSELEDLKLRVQAPTASSSSPPVAPKPEAWFEDTYNLSQGEILTSTLSGNGISGGDALSRSSADSTPVPSGVSTVKSEDLRRELSRALGHAKALKSHITKVERGRDLLVEELAKVTEQQRLQQNELAALPVLKAKLDETERRNEIVLQMLGERDERIEELQLDIEDVRACYKLQIDQLTSQ